MFAVLIEFHLMVGIDLHKDIVPAVPPVEVPFAPHATSALLNWVMPPSISMNVRATQLYARVMQRGTDIQSFIPHIPLSPAVVLAPLLTVTSGSKSHFGPAGVTVNKMPIAAAIFGLVNMNLQCGDVPSPTGLVVAPNTVVTNMTLGDILGGMLAFVSDMVIQALVNEAMGDMGDYEGAIAQLFLGTPLGYSFNSNGDGPVGYFGRQAGNVGNLARGLGELLGGAIGGNDGDIQHGKDDAKSAGKGFVGNVVNQFDVLGWKEPQSNGGALYGIYSASQAHDRVVQQKNAPPPALDNPNAEQH